MFTSTEQVVHLEDGCRGFAKIAMRPTRVEVVSQSLWILSLVKRTHALVKGFSDVDGRGDQDFETGDYSGMNGASKISLQSLTEDLRRRKDLVVLIGPCDLCQNLLVRYSDESHLNSDDICLARETAKHKKLGFAQLSLTNGCIDVDQTALCETMLTEDFSEVLALDDEIGAGGLQDTDHHVRETLLEPVGTRIVTEPVKVEDAKGLNSGRGVSYRLGARDRT